MKFLLILFFFVGFNTIAQTGTSSIKGTITNNKDGETVFNCRVILYRDTNSTMITGAVTDFDGNYVINNIAPGDYTLKITNELEGLETQYLEITLLPNEIMALDFEMKYNDQIQNLEAVMVISEKRRSEQTAVRVEKISKRQSVESISSEQLGSKGVSSASNTVKRTPGVFAGRKAKKMAKNQTANAYNYQQNDGNQYNAINDNNFQKVKKEPLSTFSIDVDKGAYTNIRRHIRSDQLPPSESVRIEECINYFDYDYAQPQNEDPFAVVTEYTDCPWNKQNKLVHIGIKGLELDNSEMAANNLVFLVDISGSMGGADRIELVKSGLLMMVDQMRSEDRIAIVTYAGSSQIALNSTKGSKKEEIKLAIQNLYAGGSTNGSSAIEMAYEIAEKNFDPKGNNRIILATDGDFNVGITDQDALVKMIEKKRENGVFLSVLGVGQGNLHDGQMEQIADHGNGSYFFLDNLLEAKRVMVNDLTGLLYTIAKDVKLQIEFNPKHVQSYRLVGYANRMLEAEDFNDDTKDAGELGSGHTVTAFYEIIPVGVEIEEKERIDPLKYQEVASTSTEAHNAELFTLKLRYKEPDAKKSKLITHICTDNFVPMEESSESCQFASAVAEFGLLLRNSEHKGSANYTAAIERARNAKGKDKEGKRAECIQLMESAEIMSAQASLQED